VSSRDTIRRVAGTVRFRVTALATLAVFGVLVVSAVGLVLAQERFLTENLEESLEQAADSFEAVVHDGEVPAALGGFGDDDSVAQLVGADGQVVAATSNVAGRPPIGDPPPPGRSQTVRAVDGLPHSQDKFTLLTRRIDGPDGRVVLHMAATLSDIEESRDVLAASLTAAVPAMTVLLAALVWWLVGRTLRPVDAIRAEVADIGGSDLHRRVPEPAGDDEIALLARTMNGMLERVDRAAQQQQQFVADAAHELRSPLTRMRSELEVDLAHPDGADPAATHRSLWEETTALQRLVEDLLHLARSDATATASLAAKPSGPVDLDDIVAVHARDLRAGGKVQVDTSGVGAARVSGDATQLSRAVANLADNAARHATTTVTFALGEHDGSAVLSVSDDGPGIPRRRPQRCPRGDRPRPGHRPRHRPAPWRLNHRRRRPPGWGPLRRPGAARHRRPVSPRYCCSSLHRLCWLMLSYISTMDMRQRPQFRVVRCPK
jgi:signal transduction histidine kinase